MTTALDTAGAEAIYDFWLGLIPQFFGPFGVRFPAGDKAAAHSAAKSPPSDWFAQWTAAMLPFAEGLSKSPGDAATQAAQTMFGTWSTMMAPYAGGAAKTVAGATPAAGAASLLAPWTAVLPFAGAQGSVSTNATAAAMQPFHTAQQAWLDTVAQVGFASPQSYLTGFERTFGGLFDALGFGPMRKLQTACQDLATASLAQNQARAAYAMIVQGAFTSGLERLMLHLGSMADAGERVESVLTLLKMWAVKTEEAVHEVLQSEQGLVATAALTRAGLSHRRKLQRVAGIVADSLDLATRRELDDVYRELHELKRELRVLRQPAPSKIASATAPRRRVAKRKTKS